jgi:hypothetical protein
MCDAAVLWPPLARDPAKACPGFDPGSERFAGKIMRYFKFAREPA